MKVLNRSRNIRGIAHGDVIIDNTKNNCIYIWEFQATKRQSQSILFGITSSRELIRGYPGNNIRKNIFYYYYDSDGNINYPNFKQYADKSDYDAEYWDDDESNDYGKRLANGDNIKLEFNVKRKTIKYYINNIDQGIAFRNIHFSDKTKYNIFVSMYTAKDSVQMIDFKCI